MTEVEQALGRMTINHLPLPEGLKWRHPKMVAQWPTMTLAEKVSAVAIVVGPTHRGDEGVICRAYERLCAGDEGLNLDTSTV